MVIGISKDSVNSHLNFATKYNLPFVLLSDSEISVIQAYGVWQEKKLYGTAITKIGKGRNSAEPIEKRTVLNGIRTALKEAAKNVPVCKSSGFPCAVEIRYTRTEFAAEKLRKLNAAGVAVAGGGWYLQPDSPGLYRLLMKTE